MFQRHLVHGWLTVFTGCMFSEKTAGMLTSIFRHQHARRKTLVFKPKRDRRTGDWVESRNGMRHPAIVVESAPEILAHADLAPAFGIDEGQFFDYTLVSVAEALVARGKFVYVSGTDTDFFGNPIAAMPQLMAVAQEVHKLYAVCDAPMADRTVCGQHGVRSQFLGELPAGWKHGDAVIDDGTNYAPRCLDHFVPPVIRQA